MAYNNSQNAYNLRPLSCPRCGRMMEWWSYSDENPHMVDYICDADGIGCNYQGTYDWHLDTWEEHVPEDGDFLDELVGLDILPPAEDDWAVEYEHVGPEYNPYPPVFLALCFGEGPDTLTL